MTNLEIWEKLKTPPQSALKEIKGGRLKGMHDISPQWRYQALTEQFGPCGVGWKYTIEKLWLEDGFDNQVCAFALVNFYFMITSDVADIWSEPIPGVGGSMLIEKESKGQYTSDEAFKMAVTDALGTAVKMIGVAADVYLGNMDGSKYRGSGGPEGNDSTDIPDCPKCGKKGRESKKPGDKYYCWKKKDVADGCGHTWNPNEHEVERIPKFTLGEWMKILEDESGDTITLTANVNKYRSKMASDLNRKDQLAMAKFITELEGKLGFESV